MVLVLLNKKETLGLGYQWKDNASQWKVYDEPHQLVRITRLQLKQIKTISGRRLGVLRKIRMKRKNGQVCELVVRAFPPTRRKSSKSWWWFNPFFHKSRETMEEQVDNWLYEKKISGRLSIHKVVECILYIDHLLEVHDINPSLKKKLNNIKEKLYNDNRVSRLNVPGIYHDMHDEDQGDDISLENYIKIIKNFINPNTSKGTLKSLIRNQMNTLNTVYQRHKKVAQIDKKGRQSNKPERLLDKNSWEFKELERIDFFFHQLYHDGPKQFMKAWTRDAKIDKELDEYQDMLAWCKKQGDGLFKFEGGEIPDKENNEEHTRYNVLGSRDDIDLLSRGNA